MSNNYIGKNSLARFLERLYETFSKKGHAHSKADILDFPIEYTEEDAIQLAIETGLITPVATASGELLLDKNNILFTL